MTFGTSPTYMHRPEFTYRSLPHRLIFGQGALDRLAEALAGLPARKPMLVCTARGAASEAARKIVGSLHMTRDAVFGGAQSHAPLSSVLAGWQHACALQPDCIIALGGGSVADTVKGIALAFAEEGRVTDFVLERSADGQLKGRQSSRPKLPIVAIPTTLSGAEVGPSFGVTDDTGKKLIVRVEGVAASMLVYDPDLLRAVPLSLLAPSAMNALAHNVEALYSKGRNPVSTMHACESLPLLYDGLEAALADNSDDNAYSNLALGAYYAAIAIANARTGIHHAICHKLAPAAGLSHGTANSIILPRALEFNLPAARPELTCVARLIAKDAAKCGELRAEDAIEALEQLAARAGLPRRLRDVGVAQDLFPALAEKIMSEPGLAFNPRQPGCASEIEGILNAAW
jgi:alcohol dehydrogenase